VIRRLLLLGISLPVAALAQLQLIQAGSAVPVGNFLDLGSTSAGDTQRTGFHLKNTGAEPVTIKMIAIDNGAAFDVNYTMVPYILAPSGSWDFAVLFHPTGSHTYSANLSITWSVGTSANSMITALLSATGVASAQLSVANVTLKDSDTIDFGGVQRGLSVTRTFTLSNPWDSAVTINSIAVSGAPFSIPLGINLPLSFNPHDALGVSFDVLFQPTASQYATARLMVDTRTFTLSGYGFDPPPPKATLTVSSQTVAGLPQLQLSIALDSPSLIDDTGTLKMQFQPNNNLPNDRGNQFNCKCKTDQVSVQIATGDSIAKFDGLPSVPFQTGTTEGTLVFTLTMGKTSIPGGPLTVPILPTPVYIDTATTERRVNDLDISVEGFDNTHSLSQLSFTFYDTAGKTMPQGAIQYDATSDFQNYFTSAQAVGGTFLMRATFHVTGDATTIGGVDVQITNPAGVTSTQRLTF